MPTMYLMQCISSSELNIGNISGIADSSHFMLLELRIRSFKDFLACSMGLKDRYWELYLHGFTPLPIIASTDIASTNSMIIYDLRFQTVSLNCMIMLCNQNFQAY